MKFKNSLVNIQELKKRLWFRIFLNVAVIFLVFISVLSIANSTLLTSFFCAKQKHLLIEHMETVAGLDLSDSATVRDTLTEISEKHNIDAEIYNSHGKVLFTTRGSQMMDYIAIGNDRFSMQHESLDPVKTEQLKNGVVFEEAVRRFDKSEFMLCYKELSSGVFGELRTQKALLTKSAQAANEFIQMIAAVCFLISVVWIFVFARRFSRPITRMNEITKGMAQLDFSRKLTVSSNDEMGQLAASVNALSDSLSSALDELKASNARLRDEIELERQLDVMRKGFVANVSHELKTPVSIISGYAEGLKMNINAEARESYCDTIIDESHRMNRLILSILELSRYESGQIPLEYKEINLKLLIDELGLRIFYKTDIEFINVIEEACIAFADLTQTEQALRVYLENACAHTPSGGTVTLTSSRTENGDIRISVFNTGSHIDEEKMPQIWQSFYRGDTSHKRESNRFGLGLSIVSAIMKMHKKDCGVYNTGEGVCFWLELESADGNKTEQKS